MNKIKLTFRGLLMLCCFSLPGVLLAIDDSSTLNNSAATPTTATQPVDPAHTDKAGIDIQKKRLQHRQNRSAHFQKNKGAQHAKQVLKQHHKKLNTNKQARLEKGQTEQPISSETNS